ncbi:uncharacterized protein LOC114286813 isoform X1 [Camellia sinensis]|uniref:uncharacterized protein LOC114286813 isoform X1 n=1 Tax=Camellia sinensis TaxID=4442 RepID=UPI0010365A45|nr:uncharacterized protein LOC114286813 isoform X1 [Camellia sinensis]
MVVNVILQKMSGTATTSILISSPTEYLVRRRRSRDRGGGGGLFLFPNHQAILSLRSSSAISQTQTFLLTYPPYAPHKTHHNHNTTSTSIFTPLFKPPFLMKWQDCKVKMDVEVPTSVAYDCYSDRQAIPCWMPFISSVEILEAKPDLSRWSLKYKAFGRDIEFSWLARNMQPIPNQKIQWRSLEGLPNRGAVRFFPKGPSSCVVELTVSYEVPQLLVPLASVSTPTHCKWHVEQLSLNRNEKGNGYDGMAETIMY